MQAFHVWLLLEVLDRATSGNWSGLAARSSGPRRGYGAAPGPAAAILSEIRHPLAHEAAVRCVEKLAANPPLGEQPGARQVLQVERERGRHQPDALRNFPGRQSLRSLLDEEAENSQPVLVGEGGKRRDDLSCLHGLYDNTRIVEIQVKDSRAHAATIPPFAS